MKQLGLFVLFLGTICLNAQSFKLYNVVNLEEGEEVINEMILKDTCVVQEIDGILSASGETYAVLENTSEEDKMVVCKREFISMLNDAETYFCWNGCNDVSVSINEMIVEANTKTGVLDFSTHYEAPLSNIGSSIVRYIFYDKDNRNDSISVTFEYITLEGLSVHTYEDNISLSIYPNPVADYLMIEINDSQLKQASVVLYDMLGRTVKIQELTSAVEKVNVNSLEEGIYYLQIIHDNRTIGLRKFVKQ